jgi:hypothetical protein
MDPAVASTAALEHTREGRLECGKILIKVYNENESVIFSP